MVLGLIALHGPGALSIDNLVVRALRRRFPGLRVMPRVSCEGLPRVLIVGGGFGGVAAAKALRNTSCRVTLVDPSRPLSRSAKCSRPARRRHRCRRRSARGDHAGCPGSLRLPGHRCRRAPQLLGHDEWAPFAPGLKQIDDATSIRSRLLLAFEQAENAD